MQIRLRKTENHEPCPQLDCPSLNFSRSYCMEHLYMSNTYQQKLGDFVGRLNEENNSWAQEGFD